MTQRKSDSCWSHNTLRKPIFHAFLNSSTFHPWFASMNHCQPSEDDDGRRWKGMTESRDGEKEMCVTLELKGPAEVSRGEQERKRGRELESERDKSEVDSHQVP